MVLKETPELAVESASVARVRHAANYPFDQYHWAYLYRNGRIERGPLILEGRTAVAAAGSNGSPAQLQRKFGDCPEGIPVTNAIVRDHAVVYSAHFSKYGSLPAMLWPEPRAIVGVFVTWLTAAQLTRMHETEALGANYEFAAIVPAAVTLAPQAEATAVHYYRSLRGPLMYRGRPIRLAEIWSGNCALPILSQPAALRFVHRRLGIGLDFEAFLERIIDDPAYRLEQTRALSRTQLQASSE